MKKILAVGIIALIAISLASPVQVGIFSNIFSSESSQNNIISIEDVELLSGEKTTVPILINNATSVAGIKVNLSYNPAIVNVTNLTLGDFDDSPHRLELSNAANGYVWVYVVEYSGLSGNKIVANVELNAVGDDSDTSNLNISIISLKDDAGDGVTDRSVENGIFTILSSFTTYGNGWKEVRYVNGRVIHADGIRTFQGWDGVWRPYTEWNNTYTNISGNLIADGGNFKSIFYPHKNRIVTDKFSFSQQPSALRFLNIETKAHTKVLDASAASQITLQHNKLIYEDIYPNIDYEFTYNGIKLKEDIVSHRTNYPNSSYPLDKTYLVFSTKLWEFSGIHKLIDDDGEITTDKDIKGILKLKHINEDILSYLPIGRAYSTFQINETVNEIRTTKVHNRLIKVSGTWYLFSGINYTWVKDVNRTGDITIDPTWVVGSGGNAWSGDVSYDGTTEVQSTGDVELRREVDDYVSHWRMDKGTGNTAYDENETSNNDGSFTNGSTGNWTSSSKYGDYALDFDGTDDYVDCGNNANLKLGTDDFTIVSWFKTGVTGYRMIVGRGYGISDGEWSLIEDTGADLRFIADQSTIDIDITTDINDNQWHFGAFVKNGDNGYIYLDDVYTNSVSGIASANLSSTKSLYIGANDIPSRLWDGTIDEVRIYNRALSNDEINQTMDNEHKTEGNLTSWHNASSNNETYKLSVNFTFLANTNASINLYNNDTGAFIETLATNNNTEQWSKTISSPVQDSKVNITLYGNVTQTPEVHNITYHTQSSAEEGTTPSISNITNSSINSTAHWVDWDVNQTAHNRWNYSLYSNMSGSSWSSWQNSTAAPNITVTGLIASTTYYYQVQSCNTTNTSLCTNSTVASFTTSAVDTSFTVTLPTGYSYASFNLTGVSGASTQTNYEPEGQNASTAFYNVTNTGDVSLDIRMQLNATLADVTLKSDTDSDPTGAKEVNTTLVTIYSNLGQSASVDIWIWSDFDHTVQQDTNRTLDINVTES